METILRALRFGIIFVILCYFSLVPSFGQDTALLNNNKEAIKKYFDLVINAHNLDRKGDFFQTDYILHTMDGKVVQSSQDSLHISLLRWLFIAIPDVHYKISNIVVGGEWLR